MIVEACFDVHGADAQELRERAVEVMERFVNGPVRDWTITIEASEETATMDGRIALWRGVVTARAHRQTYEP